MTSHPSNKTILTLSVIAIVVMILSIIYMVVSGNFQSKNCWDKYSTEQEAIQNCEGK